MCRQLHEREAEVWAYDVSEPAEGVAAREFRRLDIIADVLALPAAIDAVYYLAQSPFYRQFPDRAEHLFGVNSLGAVKAAQAACAAGAKFFCYASTGNVYAPSLGPLVETDAVRRDNPYALSKLAAEESLRLFSPWTTVVAARLFGLFGPGQKNMLPAILQNKVQTGGSVLLEPAPGESPDPEGLTISFCYVDDTARCLHQLALRALRGEPLPPVVNVAGPEPISVRRFASTLGRLLGKEPNFARATTTRAWDLIADLGLLRSLVEPQFLPFEEAAARAYA
jgi:nucleoside-diphosphate-sugar epimerase